MREGRIDITGIDKGELLQALYAASAGNSQIISLETALSLIGLKEQARSPLYFDVINGRKLNVDISGREFLPLGYDVANGSGAAQKVVEAIRESKKPKPESVKAPEPEPTPAPAPAPTPKGNLDAAKEGDVVEIVAGDDARAHFAMGESRRARRDAKETA